MDQPTTSRRFRFGLRNLLVVVTLAAVGSWAYWFGWPWWSLHREQMRFEAAVQKMKIGMTQDEELACLPDDLTAQIASIGIEWPKPDLHLYLWPNAVYYIINQLSVNDYTAKIRRIEVFRLPSTPSKTVYDQDHVEFLRMISDGLANTKGFQYELIYSDPPK